MPLRDHFHPPLSDRRKWDGVHGMWPAVIVQQLVELLPPEYEAEPRVHLGSQFEVDIATFDAPSDEPFGIVPAPDRLSDQNGGTATAVWAPGKPTLATDVDLNDFDEYEVLVYDIEQGRRLVAAIEIISPANKDRPESRNQFTTKCAALLQQEVAIVLVDVVTSRRANLYADLISRVGQTDAALGEVPPATYAVACRWRPHVTTGSFQSWYHTLAVEAALPVLPVWLHDQLAIPLDLESAYEQTCRTLRIR
ncbi:MAG: DUF4058 family protein [Planctomycetota bacterium]|nr:DUF4058 family protein [Planctomycetota bacterium]